MRTKNLIFVLAALALGAAANATEKPGKPIDIKPSPAAQPSDGWRERAMRARAEVPPDAPITGNARARDERGDRRDGEESGGGRLREDRGEGASLGE